MKNLLVLLLVVAVAVGSAYAGDAKPMTKAGDKAILFTLNGLSNLGADHYAGGIGGRYYFSNNMALRLGLGFSSATTTPPSGPKTESTGFSFVPAFIYNIAVSNDVSPYVGAQIAYATVTSKTPAGSTGQNETTTSGFGIGAILGVEWWAWSNVSLAAEYQLSYMSGSQDYTPSGGTKTSSDYSSFELGSVSGANLTVAFHF